MVHIKKIFKKIIGLYARAREDYFHLIHCLLGPYEPAVFNFNFYIFKVFFSFTHRIKEGS